MKKNNTTQGLYVIGLLTVVTLGLSAAYVGTRSSTQIPHAQQTQQTQKKEQQIEDAAKKGKEMPELGTLGHIDDPKFSNIVAQIHKNDYQGSVLLIRNGKPIWQQGFGEMAPGVSFNPDTPVSIASMTKNVTACLLMKELTRQQISLDTPVSKFYPTLPGANETTLRDLVRMDAPYKGKGYAKDSMTEEAYMDFYLNNLTYEPKPDTKWKYNAADYQLLTNILYKLTGVSYDDLIEMQLQPKYDILNVYYFNQLQNRPVSYDKNNQEIIFEPQKFEREVGTGNLFMSPWQSYRFVRDQIQGQNLTMEEFKDMTKPRENKKNGYVAGLYVKDFGYKMHGMIEGFEPSLVIDKTGENAVVMFSNRSTRKIDKKLAEPIFKELMSLE